jgi:hypothetical protein
MDAVRVRAPALSRSGKLKRYHGSNARKDLASEMAIDNQRYRIACLQQYYCIHWVMSKVTVP